MALIALICFFLPWVHLSCGASENRLSGVDLARDWQAGLWLIPLLMLAVLFIATARAWKNRRELSALVCLVAGLVSAYLMNRERMRAENTSGLIAVGLTGWFWLETPTSKLILRCHSPGFLASMTPGPNLEEQIQQNSNHPHLEAVEVG
jgi:hypothetical protein